jgi:PDZ domain/PEGA domain
VLRDPPVDRSVVVRFRGTCLVEEARTVSITAEAMASLDTTAPLLWFGDTSAVRMRPDVGTLRVTSLPTDADVFIDGSLAGRSPFERNVCVGERRVRVRHRIGSQTTTVRIARGRTEVIDITLKPGLAFLGAVDASQGAPRPSPDLTTAIDRALASVVKSFRLSSMVDLPPEAQRWTDSATVDLLTAADAGDGGAMKRLLRVASENYDAPLMLGAVARAGAGTGAPPVDLLLFWYDHAAVDRIRVPGADADALAAALQRLDRPSDSSELVYQNDIGLRLVDTDLEEAPLLAVTVDPGSAAAAAGVRTGDAVSAVDGARMSASEFVNQVTRKKPGESVVLSVGGAASPRRLSVAVQRRPRRAPVFDPALAANALLARLQAASAMASSAQERDLLGFSTALVLMRLGQSRAALDLLSTLGPVPSGPGVGRGAVLYYRARCHLEAREQDRAVTLLREAAAAGTDALADDGATTETLAKLRLSRLGQVAGPPAPIK